MASIEPVTPLLHVGPVPVEEVLVVGAPSAAMLAATLRLWWRARAGGPLPARSERSGDR